MSSVLKHMSAGSPLQVRHQSIRFSKKFLFLSDMDAYRATFGRKGASGLRPCLRCGGVISKSLRVDSKP